MVRKNLLRNWNQINIVIIKRKIHVNRFVKVKSFPFSKHFPFSIFSMMCLIKKNENYFQKIKFIKFCLVLSS